MDMKNSNKMSAWVLANDAGGSGRPRRLNPGFSSLSPGMESWHTGVKVWLPAVCLGRTHTHTTQGCPALPSPITLCHFLSAICAGPSLCLHPETRQKQVKMAAPGGAVMTAATEEAAGRGAGLLCDGRFGNWPGSSRFMFVQTTSQRRHLLGRETGCSTRSPPSPPTAARLPPDGAVGGGGRVGDLKFKF